VTLNRALTIFSAIAFLGYGIVCVSSRSMVGDFRRFGLEHLRILTGVLEILGGIGLLVGLWWLPAQVIAGSGLALLMLCAFAIRLHVRDSVAASLPSFLLMLLNGYIVVRALQSRP
jgi:uncharacterized membrane protein